MRREAQNVLLLLLGVAVGAMVVKGTYLNYVKPSLLPWLVIAAGGLLTLASACIVRDIRERDRKLDDSHRHGGVMVWLLLVPVVVIAFVVPPPIEAGDAALSSVSQPPRDEPPPLLPADRAPEVSLPEVVLLASADSGTTPNDRLITVIGFKLTGLDGGPDLARVVMICCAADARLMRIHLTGPEVATAASYPSKTWLRIEGRVVPGSASAETSFEPTMTVTSVTRIEKPANPYAF